MIGLLSFFKHHAVAKPRNELAQEFEGMVSVLGVLGLRVRVWSQRSFLCFRLADFWLRAWAEAF